MPSTIRPDGRISTPVQIRAPARKAGDPEMSVPKKLVADTGGSTIIPYENVRKYFKTHDITPGAATDSNFGPRLDLDGATMDIEVEKEDGSKETRHCSKMGLHFAPEETFAPDQGLLGMDQFDTIKADPRKNADGTRAYISARKDDKKEEKKKDEKAK